jgi:phosphate starvation-inducible protein PhoH and related proteins
MSIAKKSLKLGFKKANFTLKQKQEEYLKIMMAPETRVVFLSGGAGTSKSYLSVLAALNLYNLDGRKKLLYLRTAVESAERSIGYLKGDANEKFANYEQVFHEKLDEILDSNSSSAAKTSGIAKSEPMNFLRGRTFLDEIVIIDECNNCSLREIKTAITRIGIGSKIFICGDPEQVDIKNSGFAKVMEAFNNEESREKGIFCLKFEEEDIVRDEIIKFILATFKTIP